MRTESKLCHISEDKVIVIVKGWIDGENAGSALAEGKTVEIAEDKAISRLTKRINQKYDQGQPNQNKASNISKQEDAEVPKIEQEQIPKVFQEPNDWSNELTAIDHEIKRLNWTRDNENSFLENNFGYNNRNKITKYAEIVSYLDMLKKLDNVATSIDKKDKTKNLILETDILLKELSWDNNKGREYLKKEFNVLTRKELDEQQLISFVSMLKSIRNEIYSNKTRTNEN